MGTCNKKFFKKLAWWIIGIVSTCIIIYLSIRYIHIIGSSIWELVQIVLPLLIGIILAMILNIPMNFFELRLFSKWIPIKSSKVKRNLSIILALVCIIGILVLAFFLVVPEFIQAIITLINIGIKGIQSISDLTETLDYSSIPFGNFLKGINIDWEAIVSRLQNFLPAFMNKLAKEIPNILGSSIGFFVNISLGLIFAIYILSQKELLKKQTTLLIHVWIPQKLGNPMIHIVSVYSDSFRNFIIGQTTEAVILGSLCTIGMAILQLPYAPTIGVLVGVTAFIPYVGAYLGAILGFIMILTVKPFKAVIFLIFLIILQQVEGNIIYPKVVGKKINLPSLWVLAALTIGGNIAGPIGMLFGVPVFSATYNLIAEATQNRKNKKECASRKPSP